jgi:hypothetical protein
MRVVFIMVSGGMLEDGAGKLNISLEDSTLRLKADVVLMVHHNPEFC